MGSDTIQVQVYLYLNVGKLKITQNMTTFFPQKLNSMYGSTRPFFPLDSSSCNKKATFILLNRSNRQKRRHAKCREADGTSKTDR